MTPYWMGEYTLPESSALPPGFRSIRSRSRNWRGASNERASKGGADHAPGSSLYRGRLPGARGTLGRCREHGGELCPVCPGERQRITDDADMCWRLRGCALLMAASVPIDRRTLALHRGRLQLKLGLPRGLCRDRRWRQLPRVQAWSGHHGRPADVLATVLRGATRAGLRAAPAGPGRLPGSWTSWSAAPYWTGYLSSVLVQSLFLEALQGAGLAMVRFDPDAN